MHKQINKYFGPILSKCQFRFRKGYSAQQCLLIMTEKWRASLDQNVTCAALLTDLSKAFDCLPHDLFMAKLHAYVCDLPPLNLLNCYLRKRRQGSILGLILDIFLSDLILFIKNKAVASYD